VMFLLLRNEKLSFEKAKITLAVEIDDNMVDACFIIFCIF